MTDSRLELIKKRRDVAHADRLSLLNQQIEHPQTSRITQSFAQRSERGRPPDG